ncbi:MAG TPA: copper homeostasis periplasmic binding protein CopC [Polyangiaceae bacterium]|jgi:methionine-rich copper-binding protein CopC|nr:copper homeostasis periplasmic binding protein CopC [Polyangiaceae bacterium]
MKIWFTLAALLVPVPALAHAMLEQATPAANAKLARAPKEIVLRYSEALEPAFTKAEVKDSKGVSVAASTNVKDQTMRVTLKPLGPGVYRVTWHAVSVDTHRIEGAYSFTVKP